MKTNNHISLPLQTLFISLLLCSGLTTGALGIYALATAPTLYIDSEILSIREGIDITKIEQVSLKRSDLWKLPAFSDPDREQEWWKTQQDLYATLNGRDTTTINFTSNDTSWTLSADIKRMPLEDVFIRIGLSNIVGFIFIFSAIYVLRRHTNKAGLLCAFFLGSTALYLISIAPVVHRTLIIDNNLMHFLVSWFFVTSTGQLSIIHFSMLFPHRKRLLKNRPWLPLIIYGYAISISLLYLSEVIALATTLPILFLWMLLLLASISHSIFQEKDIFMRQQMRMSLLAPLLVALFFISAIIFPWTTGGALVDHFALFSLILPFALILSLDNQRLFHDRLRSDQAMKQERERIHRELHDSVLNDLASIMIVTEGAQIFLQKDTAKVKPRLNEIKEIAVETSRQLRGLLWVVDDRQNHWRDIIGLLRKISDDLLSPCDISFDLSVDWDSLQSPQASPTVKHTIHKLYREALINITKHAQASHAKASFSFDKERVFLEISDNGKGFDQSTIGKESYGLENMKRRIMESGGEFNIKTQPGGGTSYLIQVPLMT